MGSLNPKTGESTFKMPMTLVLLAVFQEFFNPLSNSLNDRLGGLPPEFSIRFLDPIVRCACRQFVPILRQNV